MLFAELLVSAVSISSMSWSGFIMRSVMAGSSSPDFLSCTGSVYREGLLQKDSWFGAESLRLAVLTQCGCKISIYCSQPCGSDHQLMRHSCSFVAHCTSALQSGCCAGLHKTKHVITYYFSERGKLFSVPEAEA